MSFLNQIDTATENLELLTADYSGKLRSVLYGPLFILEDAIKSGAFVHPDTISARRMRQSARQLRALANDIEGQLDALEANERLSYHMQAAE